jgi:Zn-dependent protease
MFQNIDWHYFIISMFVLVVSLTVHEFAHAKAAELSGDDTARKAGRCSLNPLDHLDPFGTIMMILSSLSGFGIGWAKPVPVSTFRLRHPRWDSLKVSLWGPLSNLLLALLVSLILRLAGAHIGHNDLLIAILFIYINLALAVFNLLPVAPLDGSHIMSAILPVDQARRYDLFMARYGMLVFVMLIFVVPGALHKIIGPPISIMFRLLTGINF